MSSFHGALAAGLLAISVGMWLRFELRCLRESRARRRRGLAGRLQIEGPYRPNKRSDSSHIADSVLYARRSVNPVDSGDHDDGPEVRGRARTKRTS